MVVHSILGALPDAGVDLQIVESSEIDTSKPVEQRMSLQRATHFKSVRCLVLRDTTGGEKGDLQRYVNERWVSSVESHRAARRCGALELPLGPMERRDVRLE